MTIPTETRGEWPPDALPSVGDLFRQNSTGEVPASLLESSPVDLGVEDIPVERYTSRAFHDLEVEKVWKKVWQMACLESDIPAVGDHIIYTIADISIIVVRSGPETVSAFYNSCLHRGTALRKEGGNVDEFRCPFHGWCYDLEGKLTEVTAAWDFPQVCAGEDRVDEVKVDTWDGWVFVNMDPHAPPLLDYLGVLPDHFANWPWRGRHKAAHVVKVFPCNWKVAQEAFMEYYHGPIVHPQYTNMSSTYATQYDVFGPHISRMLMPVAGPNPFTGPDVTEQELADLWTEAFGFDPIVVPEGQTARAVIAALLRMMGGGQWECDRSANRAASDPEILDPMEYFVFPNFFVWPGFNIPLVYRARPNGNDPDSSIFEIWLMNPVPPGTEAPAPVATHVLRDDETFVDATEFGVLAPGFDQDLDNMAAVQQGLHTTPRKGLPYARYQETQIRNFHRTLEQYIGRP